MSVRISSTEIADRSLYGIGVAYARYDAAQSVINTGKQVQNPSDDPAGIAQSLNFRDQLDVVNQFERTTSQAKGLLATGETALSSVTDLLRQARTIAVQSASDTVDPTQRKSLSDQIQNIITQLGNIGNSTYGARYIFGGQRTTSPPFNAVTNGTFTYKGGSDTTNNGKVLLDVGRSETLQVNVPGDTVFTPIFAALTKLRDNISVGASASISNTDLTNLDTQINTVLGVRADFGSKIQRLDQNTSRNDLAKVSFQKYISNIEDADYSKAVIEYQTAQNAYQAAIQSTAKVFQTSLLDYLR